MSKQPFQTIWIDLENSPHVPFFLPIIRELKRYGIRVIVTARDFAQTKELVAKSGLQVTFAGKEQGANALRKMFGIVSRAAALAWLLRKEKIDLAISHGSRGLTLAAKLLRIPSLALYDYEGASVKLFNTLADHVLTPELLTTEQLQPLGLDPKKHFTYPGLKEEVYTYEHSFDTSLLHTLHIPETQIVVTVRPPSHTAHYRSDASFVLFTKIIEILSDRKDVSVLISPRNAAQAAWLKKEFQLGANVTILTNVVNGLDLLDASDVVIGGGGTMNREAAVLGTPVLSIFKGEQGAVDKWLVAKGKMMLVTDAREILPFLRKKTVNSIFSSRSRTQDSILGTIHQLLGLKRN